MFLPIFSWWLVIFTLGLISLPLTWHLFAKFYDRGYAFSKIISLVCVSFLLWLFAILKILPFTFHSIFLFITVVLTFNFFLKRKNKDFKKELKDKWRIIFFEETLFAAGLSLWAYIRSFQPNINGLEKFMDFGFVNAILRSNWFPPNDMWLAGSSINYYYFGHLETAVLTRLTQISPSITYNLMLASLCGLTLSASFSITSNLINWFFEKTKLTSSSLVGGLISAFLLTFGGNLQLLYHWLTKKDLSTYWYPDATRFIVDKFGALDNTIHEFPIYSFVVADLHGHLLDIPHVLLIVALIISLSQSLGSPGLGLRWWERLKAKLAKIKLKLPFLKKLTPKNFLKKIKEAFEKSLDKLPIFLVLGLTLGVAFMTNAWDYPIYLLYAGATLLWFNYLKHGYPEALIRTVPYCLWLVIISFVSLLPFYLSFKNIAQGIAVVDFHSPPWMLLFLWGFPLFNSICFIALTKKFAKKIIPPDYFALSFLAVSWFLIIFPEFFRIKDIYAHNHQRANTMFKLTYQSFIVFRLLAGYILVRITTQLKDKKLKKVFLLIFFAGVGVIMTYPRFAIKSYYNGLRDFKGLDGVKYLASGYPDDYQAILWLTQEIKGAPVIVEAVGESYTDHARVSANTGLPTILGWRVHEWLWRGTFDISGKRTEEVKKIYTSQNEKEIKDLLEKYQVKLIFVGTLERQAYQNLNEKIFASLGKVVFASGQTKIYQLD